MRLLLFSLLVLSILFMPFFNIIKINANQSAKINFQINQNDKIKNLIMNDENQFTSQEDLYEASKKALTNIFIENKGQLNLDFLFYSKVNELTIGFKTSEIIFMNKEISFSIKFIGSNNIRPKGLIQLDSFSNFYFSNKQFTKIPHYQQLIFENLYDGIDLLYKITEDGIKYDFIVDPFTNIDQITMEYHGIDNLEISSDKILISKETISVFDQNLVAWYEDNKEIIPVQFKDLNQNALQFESSTTIGFETQRNYDYSRRIIIDPLICSFSTFLGGSDAEHSIGGADIGEKCLDIDAEGNIIIAGRTSSTDFPVVDGYMDTLNGSCDASIVKMAADGQSLLFATYFGGFDEDWVSGCAVDSEGSIVVCGPTFSPNFPTKNAFQDNFLGSTEGYSTDAYLAKFDENGSLVFSTLWGGSKSDWGYGIAFDSSNNIYFAGTTSSDDMYTKNAHQDTFTPQPFCDMFLAKFSPNGQTIYFSTYFGGEGADVVYDLEVDSSNRAVIVGSTDDSSYPTLNPIQTTAKGLLACAVAKFSTIGNLIFSTTIDGDVQESVFSVGFDTGNNILLTGSTTSLNYPVYNATQSTNAGGLDMFITKLSPNGQEILYSTYFGGAGGDEGHDIVLDKDGNYVVVGKTTSANFTIKHAYQYYFGGNYDAFITVIANNGTLLSSSYLGGSGNEDAIGVRVDDSNRIIVGGYTLSSNFPVENAFQSSKSGVNDMFVSKFTLDLSLPDITPTPSNTESTSENGDIPITSIICFFSLLGGCTVIIKKKK